jgi:signal transduction histidine kinase
MGRASNHSAGRNDGGPTRIPARRYGSITVSAARKSGCIEVSVSDRGPGLSPEQQAGLFHPFPNPPSENRPQQGTGLGLSVVKAIVEAQGGQVGMHDRPGGGAIFWFTLLEAPPESDAGAAS